MVPQNLRLIQTSPHTSILDQIEIIEILIIFTSHVDVLEILASDELFLESSWKIIQDYDVNPNTKNISTQDKLIEKELYFFSQLVSLKESSNIV
jgi:hypothetical protein